MTTMEARFQIRSGSGARTTVADLDLRVALGRERHEPAGPPAETAREVRVCGGGARGDEEQWRRGGSRRKTRDDGGGKRGGSI